MEDILEEIVGDILDEYDEDEITIRAQKDNSLIIDGLAYLEDVEEELDADFGDTEFETLNGYLTNILGHIPTDKDVDTSIKAIGYCFTILSIGNKPLARLRWSGIIMLLYKQQQIKIINKRRKKDVRTFKICKH